MLSHSFVPLFPGHYSKASFIFTLISKDRVGDGRGLSHSLFYRNLDMIVLNIFGIHNSSQHFCGILGEKTLI